MLLCQREHCFDRRLCPTAYRIRLEVLLANTPALPEIAPQGTNTVVLDRGDAPIGIKSPIGAVFQAPEATTDVDSISRRREWEVQGRTSGNTVVNFPGPREWLGQTVPVRITRAGANSLGGEPCR